MYSMSSVHVFLITDVLQCFAVRNNSVVFWNLFLWLFQVLKLALYFVVFFSLFLYRENLVNTHASNAAAVSRSHTISSSTCDRVTALANQSSADTVQRQSFQAIRVITITCSTVPNVESQAMCVEGQAKRYKITIVVGRSKTIISLASYEL